MPLYHVLGVFFLYEHFLSSFYDIISNILSVTLIFLILSQSNVQLIYRKNYLRKTYALSFATIFSARLLFC